MPNFEKGRKKKKDKHELSVYQQLRLPLLKFISDLLF